MTIDQSLEADSSRGTCEEAVRAAAVIWKDSSDKAEAETMEFVIKANRTKVDWNVENL